MTDQMELPLFVYGTLRLGEENHHYIAGKFDRSMAATLHGFRREMGGHGFPTLIADHRKRVSGELYFLTPATAQETLAACDLLEELPVGEKVGQWYRRERVVVETDEGHFAAWSYLSAEHPPEEEPPPPPTLSQPQ